MPELKPCFHGNRLSSSRRCLTSEPLYFSLGCDKCCEVELQTQGMGEEEDKGAIKQESFTKETQVHFMSWPHIFEYERRPLQPLWLLIKGLCRADGNPFILIFTFIALSLGHSTGQVTPHDTETELVSCSIISSLPLP